MKTLKYQPFLIKPNNHELAEIFNVELKSLKILNIMLENFKVWEQKMY